MPEAAACMTCQHCATQPAITLQTGEPACTWCPEWRLETGAREDEARQVVKLAHKHERQTRIARWGALNGDLARERLEGTVRNLWPKRELLIGILCTQKR